MQNLFFNSDSSLSLAGYAELQRMLLQYCEQAGLPPWKRREPDPLPEASLQWREGLRAALGGYLQARVWVQHSKTQDGKPMMRLFLSEGESRAHQLERPKPSRHAWSLEVHEHPVWIPAWKLWLDVPVQAELLQNVLIDEMSVDALKSRLATYSVAPYSAQDWQALRSTYGDAQGMVWTDMNSGLDEVALASVRLHALSESANQEEGMVIVLPSAWHQFLDLQGSQGKGSGNFGDDLDLDTHDMFAFYGPDRRYRFAQIVQPLQLAGAQLMASARVVSGASYAYLNLNYARTGFYEASAEPLAQDQHGDWVCNLITHGDVTLNHADHVVLAGSLGYGGCLVKIKSSAERLLDWLPLYSGECSPEIWPEIAARANPRWAGVRASSDGLRPVQHPQSLLWGWTVKTGQITIEPRFAKISGFDGGLAQATEPAHPELWGLINTAGKWMLTPEWLDIDWRSPQFITVQNQAKEWGALGFSMEGRREPVGPARIIVPLQSEQAWLEAYEAENALIRNGSNAHARMRLCWHGGMGDLSTQEKIKEAIERAGQKGTASLVELAKAQPSLASLAGVFDSPRESDLMQVRLWGMRVRVLSDQGGLFNIKAGDIGHIGCSYPVTLSTFGLMQEAPVTDLPSAAHAAVGIAWQDLAFEPAEIQPVASIKLNMMKRWTEDLRALTPLSRALIFFIGALVGMCIWIALLLQFGWVRQGTSPMAAALWLLAPLVPIGAFDLWLRLSWHPKAAHQFPPPASASLTERLLYREYGLFWPPVLICPPLWLTIVILLVYLAWFAVAPYGRQAL